MPFSVVKIHILLIFVLVLASGFSCRPLPESKGPLAFETREIKGTIPSKEVPLQANFKSIKHHLIQKSCMPCHSDQQDQNVHLETKEDLMSRASDIIECMTEGCYFGEWMPPRREDGTPKKPIPHCRGHRNL